jgi:hypothetical protein
MILKGSGYERVGLIGVGPGPCGFLRIYLLGNPVNNLLARFSRKVHRAFIDLNYAVDDAAAGKEADEMSPLVDMQQRPTPTVTAEEIDRLRLRYGFWIIISGFALVFLITLISTFRWEEVTSVATVVGAVASLVGTVVGAFFGVQVGGAGKERAEAARERSEEVTRSALSMLPPESAEQLRSEMNR